MCTDLESVRECHVCFLHICFCLDSPRFKRVGVEGPSRKMLFGGLLILNTILHLFPNSEAEFQVMKAKPGRL